MAYNFNLQKILRESAESSDEDLYGKEGDIDLTLSKNNLEEIFAGSCPITGDVAAKLHESTCDPDNLRIIMDENADQYYMDYNELISYCESTHLDPDDAVCSIVAHYSDECPTISTENFNIVFPSETAFMEAADNCGKLGYSDLAWSSHFFQDCINKGINVTTFVDPGLDRTSVSESNALLGGVHHGDISDTDTTKGREARAINWAKFKRLFALDKEADSKIIQTRIDKVKQSQKKIDDEIKKVKAESYDDSSKRYNYSTVVGALYGAAAGGIGSAVGTAAQKMATKMGGGTDTKMPLGLFMYFIGLSTVSTIASAAIFRSASKEYLEILYAARENLADVRKYLEERLAEAKRKEKDAKNESAEFFDEGVLVKDAITEDSLKQFVAVCNNVLKDYPLVKKVMKSGRFSKRGELAVRTLIGTANIGKDIQNDTDFAAQWGEFYGEVKRATAKSKLGIKLAIKGVKSETSTTEFWAVSKK